MAAGKIAISILNILIVAQTWAAGWPCRVSPLANQVNGLLQNVNIPANDNRGGIETRGPQLGWNAVEIAGARQAIGACICRDGSGKAISSGHCGIVEPGMQVMTNAHLFFNEAGARRTQPLNCFFESRGKPNRNGTVRPPVRLVIPDDNSGFMTTRPYQQPLLDIAVVSLAEEVPGAIPFKLPNPTQRLQVGQTVQMISAFQLSVPGRLEPEGLEPILQQNRVEVINGRPSPLPRDVFTDGAGTEGSSASFIISRDPTDGRFIVHAMLAGVEPAKVDSQGRPINDRKAFNLDPTKPMSFARAVEIDSSAVEIVADVERRRRTQTAQATPPGPTNAPRVTNHTGAHPDQTDL